MNDAVAVPAVPLRALTLSLIALLGAVVAAVLWPEALLNQQLLASVLALIPAFLLAYYRRWAKISVLLGLGIVTLCGVDLAALLMGRSFGTSQLALFLVAPYLAIALGAGWFGELRRSASQLRVTQLQLIQSEKLESMGRLAAGVAHEVKNPLMTLLTGVKVLSKRLAGADESTRLLLQDMVDAVNRADTIIGGLLSYSRQSELRLAPVNLNAAIERSLLLTKHELETRRITVVKDLNPALPWVELDNSKIEQVLIDLFSNAVQAMGQDGILTLRTFPVNPTMKTRSRFRPSDHPTLVRPAAVVQIDDTGPGIRPDHLSKVFDPFFTTKPTGMGTGLGLSVSRQIVEMHGGTIAIANGDREGARVTLTFNLTQTEPHHDTTSHPAG